MSAPVVVRGDARALPLPDCSVDAVVCDPPYGLEFMGREWDSFRPGGKQPVTGGGDGSPFRRSTGTPSWGANGNPGCRSCGGQKYGVGRRCQCARPDFGNHAGDHARAFQSWCDQWTPEVYRVLKPGGFIGAFGATRTVHRLTSSIEDAGFEVRDTILGGLYSWVHAQGMPKHSAQLKPAWEPIVLGRRPLAGTLDANRERWGTGALAVDGCRTEPASAAERRAYEAKCASVVGLASNVAGDAYGAWTGQRTNSANADGRWPTNLLVAHHPLDDGACRPDCLVVELDRQSGGNRYTPTFRYEPKAPTWQRPQVDGRGFETVKPLDLMRWLVRLLTPPGGLVLDMFPGPGTTGQAAGLEGFRSLLVELEAAHIPFIRERLAQQVVVNRKTDEAVPVTTAPDDALSLFDLEAS